MYLAYSTSIDPAWAWAAYEPTHQSPWDLAKAGHLLRRAAFGGNWTELQLSLQEGCEKTVNRLMEGRPTDNERFYETFQILGEPLSGTADIDRLRAWWLYGLMNSPHPLLEKMTLFWHNHFATSNTKVQDVGAMLRQNQLLRRHALGQFDALVQGISKDPAMLIWLDGVANVKNKPNENYARELMELFTLGVGHYTESDIRQAARAFTGWTVKQDRFYADPTQHDDQPKTIFGKTNRFQGEDVVRCCLDQPACARFLVRKLMAYFISETFQPEDQLVEPLALRLREANYAIAPIVKIILRSNLFYSKTAYRARIKSPVEFAIGIIHSLHGRADAVQLAGALDPLGQRLFAPPSVKGWDGASSWLNSSTLLQRHNLAAALTSTEDPRFHRRCDPVLAWRKHAGPESANDPKAQVDFFLGLFLQHDISSAEKQKINERIAALRKQKFPPFWNDVAIQEHQLRALCHLILTLPEFQLG